MTSDPTICADENCSEPHDYHRLVNWNGQLLGYLCDGCYADCETEESLSILAIESLAYS